MPQDDAASTLIFMPSRWRMLLWLCVYVIFMAVLIFVIVYLANHPESMNRVLLVIILIGVIFALLLVSVACVAIRYRILRRFPSLIVGADGIVDNASLIYRGIGFLPWKKIETVTVQDGWLRNGRGPDIHQQLLVIKPTTLWQLELLSPSVQFQHGIVSKFMPTIPIDLGIGIPRFMLPYDATTIRQEMNDAYRKWYPNRQRYIRFE
jgi:hypothetical protein